TIAGNGTRGVTGNGGPAANALVGYPSGLALDAAGTLYIADYYYGRVRQISAGTITLVAGNGLFGFAGDGGNATSATFNKPVDLAADAAGSLYIADLLNGRIRRVTAGKLSTIAGNGG